MPKWIAIATLIFGLLFVTTVGSVVSTERNVRRYFGMPDYVGAGSENMSAVIARQLPRGSSRDDVQSFLSTRGIGKDGVSACETSSNVGRITCRLATNHHPWEALREDYIVSFEFDASGTLRDVSVRSVFSGV